MMKRGYVNLGRRGMTKSEARVGRYLRNEEGHGENNDGGNQGGGGSGGESGNNNGGQGFDVNTFWNDPTEGGNQNSNAGGQSQGNQGQGQGQGQEESLGQTIANGISGFKSTGIMTPEIMEQLGNNDFSGINGAVDKAIQGSMQQTLQMTTQIMQAYGEKLIEHVLGMVESKQTTTENFNELYSQIPAAKNPATAPFVKPVYEQALKKTSGNVEKAITMTKQMLSHMASSTGADLGLNVAPMGSDSDFTPPKAKTNWLESLNLA